jgi:isoquinoline 1-oxidoreductase subunit beta
MAVLSVAFGTSACALPVIPKRPKPELEDAAGWISRLADGGFRLLLPRVEMGQGIDVALQRIAALELGVDLAAVRVQLPHTGQIGPVRATVGSDSVKDFALPLAQACATLREAIAAGHTGGVLQVQAWPLAALRLGQAGASQALAAMSQGAVPAHQAIVRGLPLFAADVRVPGQCHGRVLRAPVSPEIASRALRFNEAAAQAVPGFVAIVQHEALRLGQSEGVGIVALTPADLDRIAAALAVQWAWQGQFAQGDVDAAVDIDQALREGRADQHAVHGDQVQEGAWDLDLRVDIPLAAHAPIEPRAAVAAWGSDKILQIWVGSQDVFYQRDVVSKRLGLPADQVLVHTMRVGGAFGGKTIATVELEAAVLAYVTGKPVKLQWTRAQEFEFGFHRPPSSHRLRARLQAGRIDAWWHRFASSHILFTNAVLPSWLQRITRVIGDDGVARGAQLPYEVARKSAAFGLRRLPVYTGPWRGLGAGPNGLAIESAIDECARIAGADPLAFRLQHLTGQPRLAACVRQLADAVNWQQPLASAPAGWRAGRGLACGIYKGMSYAAVVAELWVERSSGAVKLQRLSCSHDGGLVIDADQVRAQCEGNLVWGIGMVFNDHLPVADSRIGASTFADSPIPRLSQVPHIDVHLLPSKEPPSGAGETAIVAAAAAIANALRDASGWRAARFPVQPAELLQAMRRMTP